MSPAPDDGEPDAPPSAPAPPAHAPDGQLEQLLEYLRTSRGFDFTGYKRPSLARRIGKRVEAVGAGGFAAYQDHLEVHPEEFQVLFDTILINVTAFFRDPDAWDVLRERVIPPLVEHRPSDHQFRIWSAGCATGEEAYSLAICFAEALGPQRARQRVKIYATDIDETALARARTATYDEHDLTDVDPQLVERYFERDGDQYVFRPDLRRSVIFGRHDLNTDAPISRLDLLACRNTLMYFNAEAQATLVSRFHYALQQDGYLFLGRAETLLSHSDLFTPIDPRSRVFRRVPAPGNRHRLVTAVLGAGRALGPDADQLTDLAAAANPVAQLAIDVDGAVVLANDRARALLGITQADLGRPLQDLEASYRPLELRSRIERAYAHEAPVVEHDVARPLPDGTEQYFDVTVTPLFDGARPLGVTVTFVETTQLVDLRTDLARSEEDLETANEELQSTNEELETSNEELQSTNEELETTNEELQSSNEELETTNEELSSTNEELQTMNDELQRRTLELDEVNTLLESIITELDEGVVVLDSGLDVLVWNAAATELWGLRDDEVVGRSFTALDIGLPVPELTEPIRAALAGSGDQEVVLHAVNRRGRPVRCQVRLRACDLGRNGQRGVIALMSAEEREGG